MSSLSKQEAMVAKRSGHCWVCNTGIVANVQPVACGSFAHEFLANNGTRMCTPLTIEARATRKTLLAGFDKTGGTMPLQVRPNQRHVNFLKKRCPLSHYVHKQRGRCWVCNTGIVANV